MATGGFKTRHMLCGKVEEVKRNCVCVCL